MFIRRFALAASLIATVVLAGGSTARAAGTWLWPIQGPILRGYDPPDSPYGSGHRGIDIGAPVGTPILSPEAGKVTFAGKVGGHLFLTIDHGGGVSSTYSWLTSIAVHKGDAVSRGQTVARSGSGHPGDLQPSLHMGVKLNGAYVDPLAYLGAVDISGFIRLAPLTGSPAGLGIAGRAPPYQQPGGYLIWFP